MKFYLKYIILFSFILKTLSSCGQKTETYTIDASRIVYYTVDPKTQELHFFYKDSVGKRFANFNNLKTALEKQDKTLVFAMNGGMYMPNGSPQGVYIENHKELAAQL